MKRWTEFVLVACAAAVALAQWVVPATMQGILSVLLLALVALTVFSRHSALQRTIGSLNAAHLEQLESERRDRASSWRSTRRPAGRWATRARSCWR